jgi:hypothetical protein
MTTAARVRAILPVLLDLVVPTAGYFALHALGVGDAWALTVAGSATGVLTLVNSIRRRRLDALGLLVFAEIALAVTLTLTLDDPRLILLRPAFYLAVGGVVAVVTCFTGRPLTYTGATPMATKGDPVRAVAYDRAWHTSAELRRVHRQLTAFIGVAMIGYAVVRVVLTYELPLSSALIVEEIPGIVLIAVILLAIRLRVPGLRRIVDAVQAEADHGRPELSATGQ